MRSRARRWLLLAVLVPDWPAVARWAAANLAINAAWFLICTLDYHFAAWAAVRESIWALAGGSQ